MIFDFNDNIALANKNGKYGYVDTKGNELFAPEYDEASNVYKNICFVKKDEQWFRCEFK